MNEIINRIEKAGHIVVVSHINPDADSLGSASALYTFILQKHKKVSWYCKTQGIDPKLSFLPWFENIRAVFPSSADLAISLDCGDKSRMGVEVGCELVNIDHHATNTLYGDINIVDSSYISTTALLFDLFKNSDAKINKKMATALYAGVLGDSNTFTSDKVDGTTFALVSELIALGADFKVCNKNIVNRESLAALRLKAIMLKNMTLHLDARVAFFCVSRDDIRVTGAAVEDCKSALGEAMKLVHVEAALVLTEMPGGSIKGSIRSDGNLDAGKTALRLGGGGHSHRAGFIVEPGCSLKEIKKKVLNLIKKEL